jgi:MoaA/NifB/PqqE/SkfB family radical SAM enzyme
MTFEGHADASSDPPDPRRYFEAVGDRRGPVAEAEPVCLYLETTNRCNLLCETCPRTFEALEPPADMSWDLFTRIVDQFPKIARVVLHGVGEPMMVKSLPRMIHYLKARGSHVLFNTNGTLLTERKGRELIAAGLDELRVSLDAAEPAAFRAVRGKDFFARIVRNVRAFTALQRREGCARPLVSLWLTGLRETIDQLPAFIRLAREIGVGEVYLQAAALAAQWGIRFDASGASEPGTSLQRQPGEQPWSLCRRPWSLMYFTAHGRAIPCCIAPFSQRGYDGFTLGNAMQDSLREIWNGPRYQEFRRALLSEGPPAACASCGVRWSL